MPQKKKPKPGASKFAAGAPASPEAVALPGRPPRLTALDAYRGFAMLAMVSEGFNLTRVAEHHQDSNFWSFLDYQLSHVQWAGCGAWDLIQPSFMFIVGVAMPYSYAARKSLGEPGWRTVLHVLYRALALTFLGVFLRSDGRGETNFTFEDVISQIGMGYAFVYLFLGRGWKVQLAGVVAILVGYWVLFAFWPLPGADFNPATAGVGKDWAMYTGFAAHWNKHANPAGYFDQWFLNLWPRSGTFKYNPGGYQTLSFIPSMGTALIGMIAGEYLRGPDDLRRKCRNLFLAGAGCFALAMSLDGNIWPFVDWHWSLCPVVKRIWTPTWTVFAAGWTLSFLAAFLWIMDVQGWRKWAFPFVVTGMNSIAIYFMSKVTFDWVAKTLKVHIGKAFFEGDWGAVRLAFYTTFILWLIVFWMHRRKIYIRI